MLSEFIAAFIVAFQGLLAVKDSLLPRTPCCQGLLAVKGQEDFISRSWSTNVVILLSKTTHKTTHIHTKVIVAMVITSQTTLPFEEEHQISSNELIIGSNFKAGMPYLLLHSVGVSYASINWWLIPVARTSQLQGKICVPISLMWCKGCYL